MTPKQQYYKNIADTMISNLKKRGFEADYVPDRQAALRAIAPYLTKGNTVSCGGSITLTEIGFNTAVKEADCIFLDPGRKRCCLFQSCSLRLLLHEYQCHHNRWPSGQY